MFQKIAEQWTGLTSEELDYVSTLSNPVKDITRSGFAQALDENADLTREDAIAGLLDQMRDATPEEQEEISNMLKILGHTPRITSKKETKTSALRASIILRILSRIRQDEGVNLKGKVSFSDTPLPGFNKFIVDGNINVLWVPVDTEGNFEPDGYPFHTHVDTALTDKIDRSKVLFGYCNNDDEQLLGTPSHSVHAYTDIQEVTEDHINLASALFSESQACWIDEVVIWDNRVKPSEMEQPFESGTMVEITTPGEWQGTTWDAGTVGEYVQIRPDGENAWVDLPQSVVQVALSDLRLPSNESEAPVEELTLFNEREAVRKDPHASQKKLSEEYWMGHRPMQTAPLYDLLEGESLPDDVYDHPEYYIMDYGSKAAKETLSVVNSVRGNPDTTVTIYRAAPIGTQSIVTGDWVGLSRTYCELHAMHPTDPDQDMPVYSANVLARDVWFAGDDLMEYGYWGESVAVNEAKTAAVINENVIYRGLSANLPENINKLLTGSAETEEEYEYSTNGQMGEDIVRHLESNDRWYGSEWHEEIYSGRALGRHWTTDRSFAETAAYVNSNSNGGWKIVLEATYSPEDVDQEHTDWNPWQESENEVTLSTGATVNVTNVYIDRGYGGYEPFLQDPMIATAAVINEDGTVGFQGDDLGNKHKFILTPEGEFYAWNKKDFDYGKGMLAIENEGTLYDELDDFTKYEWERDSTDTYDFYRQQGYATGQTSSGSFFMLNAPSGLNETQIESIENLFRENGYKNIIIHESGTKNHFNRGKDALDWLSPRRNDEQEEFEPEGFFENTPEEDLISGNRMKQAVSKQIGQIDDTPIYSSPEDLFMARMVMTSEGTIFWEWNGFFDEENEIEHYRGVQQFFPAADDEDLVYGVVENNMGIFRVVMYGVFDEPPHWSISNIKSILPEAKVFWDDMGEEVPISEYDPMDSNSTKEATMFGMDDKWLISPEGEVTAWDSFSNGIQHSDMWLDLTGQEPPEDHNSSFRSKEMIDAGWIIGDLDRMYMFVGQGLSPAQASGLTSLLETLDYEAKVFAELSYPITEYSGDPAGLIRKLQNYVARV